MPLFFLTHFGVICALYKYLLKTELWISDFQHFHWLAGHRLSVHICVYIYRERNSMSNEFKVRFHNHKVAMIIKKTTCKLAVHFIKEEHLMSDFDFIVIERIICNTSENNIDRHLLTREAF